MHDKATNEFFWGYCYFFNNRVILIVLCSKCYLCGRNIKNSGLIVPTKGIIFIDEEELGKDISFPKSIGILLENPSFIAGYTGMKNLQVLAMIQNRVGDDEIRKAIEEVGLDPDDKRTYRKYSLGMKQRLGIAAAIMEKPDIVILDEPINALDEEGAKRVRATGRQLNRKL